VKARSAVPPKGRTAPGRSGVPDGAVELYGTANWARWTFVVPFFIWALIGLLFIGGVQPGPPQGWGAPLVLAGLVSVSWITGYFLGVPDQIRVGPDFVTRRKRLRRCTVTAQEVRSIYLVPRGGGGDNLVIEWEGGKMRISIPYVRGRGEDELTALAHFARRANEAVAIGAPAEAGPIARRRSALRYVITITALLYALVGVLRIIVG
jgi:hypothetical protein